MYSCFVWVGAGRVETGAVNPQGVRAAPTFWLKVQKSKWLSIGLQDRFRRASRGMSVFEPDKLLPTVRPSRERACLICLSVFSGVRGPRQACQREDITGDPMLTRDAAPFLDSAQTMPTPANIQIVGEEIAIAWSDGSESYLPFEKLRAASPSASNQGERDIFGRKYGGDGPRTFTGVSVLGWAQVGNYAIRFDFSDGHHTGLYTYDMLRRLGGG
jgi:DUF971 family protein